MTQFKQRAGISDDELNWGSELLRRRSYHVGNLRTLLLDLALTMLEEDGLESLSLRQLSARAGVSIGALYHHFDSRAALLGQIAAFGFRELKAEVLRANAPLRSGQVLTCALTLFDFGAHRRALHELMSDPDVLENSDAASAHNEALAAVEEVVRQAVQGRSEAEIHNIAISIWGCMRGAALLTPHDRSEATAGISLLKGLAALFETRFPPPVVGG